MKNLTILALVLTSFSFVAFTSVVLNSYEIAEDYSIKFDGRGAAGTFSGLEGEIIFDENNLDASRINVSVDATTINTGNKTQDKHARSDKWFDTENYPKITFKSNKFEKTAAGYNVIGMFEVHGFKKSETIPFTFKDNIFEGNLTINRQEYGIEGPFFAFTVSDEFEVNLRVPVK
jgi:polyisoprenoid-binding protein YceI